MINKIRYIKDETTGSYYSIQHGELIQNPMNLDGSREITGCSVDWDFVYHELPLNIDGREIDLYKHLKTIESKLKEEI